MPLPSALPDPRGLPAELTSLPELVARRTAQSATFQRADGQWTTVVTSQAMHHQDDLDRWHTIDPAFRPDADSYIIEHNSIRSRAGLDEAAAAVSAGDAAFIWQAEQLGLLSDSGWQLIAGILEKKDRPGVRSELSEDARTLSYRESWSDASLVEQYISQPGSLEHLLVLAERPKPGDAQLAGQAQWLEMRAQLQLLAGTTLWAAGRQVSGPLTTAGSLELRNALGQTEVVFEPVLAFEQERPEAAVAGEYSVEPTGRADIWQVSLRTPWQWWQAPERRYPAVIDPTMVVMKTTGDGTAGMAYVTGQPPPNLWGPGDTDSPTPGFFTGGEIVLGSVAGTDQYRGYLQFNHMPAEVRDGAPQNITQAELVLTPSYKHLPKYEHDTDYNLDWDSIDRAFDVQLWDMNLCNDPVINANCFTLQDNRTLTNQAVFNWNNKPAGVTPYNLFALTIGPSNKDGGKGKDARVDVTDRVRWWYQNRPAHGPGWVLERKPSFISGQCDFPYEYLIAGIKIVDQPMSVHECTRIRLTPENARLEITYDPPDMPAAGYNNLNEPGVPSFLHGVFESAEHTYEVQKSVDRWYAVGVRGNHNTGPAGTLFPVTGRIDIASLAGTPVAQGEAGKDFASYVLVDAYNDNLNTFDLLGQVIPSPDNDFANDQLRDYRMHQKQGALWAPGGGHPSGQPDGQWRTESFSFATSELLQVREFRLGAKWTGGIIVTTTLSLGGEPIPAANDLRLALAEPTAGPAQAAFRTPTQQGSDGLLTDFVQDSDSTRSLEFGGQTSSGRYALTIVNDKRQGESGYQAEIALLACPPGTIPTKKHDCQPIILPHGSDVLGFATPRHSILGLTIYSEGGFTNGPAPGVTWCTQNEQQGTPMIGPFGGNRWIWVAQGSVCYLAATQSTPAQLWTTDESAVGLAYPDPDSYADGTTRGLRAPLAPIFGSAMSYPANPGMTGRVTCQLQGGNCTALLPEAATLHRMAPFKRWGGFYSAAPQFIDTTPANGARAIGGGDLDVDLIVDAKDGAYSASWQVGWELYPDPTLPDPSPNTLNRHRLYEFSVDLTQNAPLPQPLNLASLELRLLNGPDGAATGLVDDTDNVIKVSGPVNAQLIARHAKITQPAAMGGATKKLQVIIMPPGVYRTTALDDPLPAAKNCGDEASCLDLRRPEYDFANGNGEVRMVDLPDISIEDQVGTLLVSTPGNLQVFSKDHPASGKALNDLAQSFSFETWGGKVKISEETCDTNQVVTVVRGEAAIALPMIGDDGASGGAVQPPAVIVGFKLCETKLKYAKLTLDISPASVPVGATGLGVHLVSGEVTIGPNHTTITFKLGFESIPSDEVLSNGYGQVTIDTRGLFEVQAGATLVGVVSAKLLLQVAWNPLDVLFAAEASAFGGLLTGALKMHAWVGQGWQNKYDWLPANDDFHFTGSIKAVLHIEESLIAPLLPPVDIDFGVKVAFGEFCVDASDCNPYEWGMSAVLTVAGADVGFYASESGPEFIFGTDDHVLIDEFGGVRVHGDTHRAVQGLGYYDLTLVQKPGAWMQHLYWPPKSPIDDWNAVTPAAHGCTTTSSPATTTCAFDIAPDAAGRALFSVAWQNDNLAVTLIKPDGTEITDSVPGIEVTRTRGRLKRITFAVAAGRDPTSLPAGIWQLRLAGRWLGNGPNQSHHNYSLFFASDPPPPTLIWTHPTTQVDGTGQIDLQWTATRSGQAVTETLELFAMPLSAYQALTDTQVISATPIANGIPANTGHYLWNTSGLASGEYAVGARLDDHRKGNGHIVSWAPGSVIIDDSTPPPVPVVLATKTLVDALTVVWQRDTTTRDLAGYLVEYSYPAWNNMNLQRVKRVLPSDGRGWLGLVERTRLGSLLQGYATTFCVRAYDASGNISGCTPQTVTLDRPETPLGPPASLDLAMALIDDRDFLQAEWTRPTSGTPQGYLLSYQPIGCLLPGPAAIAHSGQSPVNVGGVLSDLLGDLKVGQRYRIAVAGYDDAFVVGPEIAGEIVFTNPTDDTDDGLPDAWQAIFDLWQTNWNDDVDADGLTNEDELLMGSYPTKADSDQDGYYDGYEVSMGTDPCDGNDSPNAPPGPQMAVAGRAAATFTAATNLTTTAPGVWNILNRGNGLLEWSATASAPWINLTTLGGGSNKVSAGPATYVAGDQSTPLQIGVDASGLAPGRYRGEVAITNISAAAQSKQVRTMDLETFTLDITLTMAPEQTFDVLDLQAIASAWNTASRSWDLTGDGWVSIVDVQIAAANWAP